MKRISIGLWTTAALVALVGCTTTTPAVSLTPTPEATSSAPVEPTSTSVPPTLPISLTPTPEATPSARIDPTSTSVPPTPVATVTPMPPSAASLEKLVAANTEFGFNLLAELRKQGPGENIFISPLSISTALAMTYNGAAGDTARAMAETLKLGDMNLDEVNRASAALLANLDGLNPQIEVNISNSLWARRGVEFRADFLERNQVHFGAEVTSLDFNDPNAKDVINDWVERSTKGKIDSIVDRIDPLDVLFLINAIYFNGQWWPSPFDKTKTKEQEFYLADGTTNSHPMMSRSGKFDYLKGETFRAVKLPYTNRQVGMYVFLPNPDSSLDEFLERLTVGKWQSWMRQFSKAQGPIVLPRFKLEYESELNGALVSRGMGPAFDPSQADFSGMHIGGGLSIDRVMHKAVVEVNEEGTEAAAVTAVEIEKSLLLQFEFVVDRPFFFAIRDDETGAILFMGAVYEPEE